MRLKRKNLKAPNGAGSVYKLSGRRRKPWIARITTGFEIVVATKGKDKSEEVERQKFQVIGYFEKESEARQALLMHQAGLIPEKATITLKQVYGEWSESHYKDIGNSTKRNYILAFGRLSTLHGELFAELRTSHFQKIIDELGLSRSSLADARTLVKQLYDYAIQNDITNKNYAEFIKLPKEEKDEKKIFSDLHIQTMIKNIGKSEGLDSVLVLCYTGMRVNEFLPLTKFNIDLEKGIITGGIKTDAGKDRLIPIHPKIMPIIKRWYNKLGEFLFSTDEGKKVGYKKFCNEYYYPALEKFGLPKLTPHSTRHTFGSRMAEAKVNTLAIQKIIGHSDYSTTANIYTHVDVEFLKEAISKI